jgi:hypothetical protein
MTPQQQAIIIDQTVQGATTRDIEAIVGLDHATIARAQHKPEIQKQIASIKAQLIDQAAQQSADNIIYVVSNYKQGIKTISSYTKEGEPIETVDAQLREHGFKASCKILESCGLLPHTQAPTLIQINNNITLTPQMERLMQISAPADMPTEAQEIIDL